MGLSIFGVRLDEIRKGGYDMNELSDDVVRYFDRHEGSEVGILVGD